MTDVVGIPIRRAVVLGAGAMGSGIAAHLANAGIPSLLLDLPHPDSPNRLAAEGIAAAAKGRAPGFAHPDRVALVTPGNFDDHLRLIADADWVVEAVVERMDVKVGLLGRVAAHLAPHALLTTNTSGLSVNEMALALPAGVRPRFFGTHFFNPPRHMYLLELVSAVETDEAVVASFQDFAERRLGKGVVRGKDTPNFVANRIGIFSTVYAMWAMERHGLTVEEVDAATGQALARSTTATFGTADLAGLDVLAHAVRTQHDGAPADEQRDTLRLPAWVTAMVERGALGRKAGAGFYAEKGATVIEPHTLEYRPRCGSVHASLAALPRIADPGARAAALVAAPDAAGRFAWDLTAATLLYSARRIPEIADDLASVDRAMRWGYAWELGPFELWDALGVAATVERMQAEGRAVPDWVRAVAASPAGSFYEDSAAAPPRAWDPRRGAHMALPARPRALSLATAEREGRVLRQNEHARLVDLGEGVACVVFRTKANIVSEGVLLFVEETLARAGRDYEALVLGNEGALFSAGADLAAMAEKIRAEDWPAIDATLRTAQRVMTALKFAAAPVVAAPFGRVLGGGLEVCLHCHRNQASLETYMGLVEVGVGLVPAAGGIKESLIRVLEGSAGRGDRSAAAGSRAGIPAPALLQQPFDAIMQATTSGSALEAFDLGYLRPGDGVTMDRSALLHAAKQAALALLETGWQPVTPRKLVVTGRDGLAYLRVTIHNMREGGWISDHDALIGDKVAWALAGGDVDAGSMVDEEYLLSLERAAFLELCREPKTLARIEHMLETGRPLRN